MSKFSSLEHRVPLEDDNVSVTCNDQLCKKCKLCIKACTNVAGVYPLYDLSKNGDHGVCINCGQCRIACPFNAITEVSNIDLVEEALKDKDIITVFLTAPAVRVSLGDAFGAPSGTNVKSKMVSALKSLGADYVLDVTMGADLTIMEEAAELFERIKNRKNLPMYTSCCPGWVKFAELFYPDMLDNLSSCKSPIAMQATCVKTYFAAKNKLNPEKIRVISVTPCTAKKFECDREELNAGMHTQGLNGKDCDISITTNEFANMIKNHNLDFLNLEDKEFDSLLGTGSGAGLIFGNSGGVTEACLRTLYYYINGKNIESKDFIKFEAVRGLDYVKEANVDMGEYNLSVCVCNKMAEAKKVIDEIRAGIRHYDFIEVMACEGGCANGGGQIKILKKPLMEEAKLNRNKTLYETDEKMKIRYCHENPNIKELYDNYLIKPLSEKSHELLHTSFVDRSYEVNEK